MAVADLDRSEYFNDAYKVCAESPNKFSEREQWDMAKQIYIYENNGISSTQAGVIAGYHFVEDAIHNLWENRKSGIIEESRLRKEERRKICLMWELLDSASQELKRKTIRPDAGMYASAKYPWLTCSIDGVVVYPNEDGTTDYVPLIIEAVSFTEPYSRTRWGRGKTPPLVLIRALIVMTVTGADYVHIHAWTGDFPQHRTLKREDEAERLEGLFEYISGWRDRYLVGGGQDTPNAYAQFPLEEVVEEEIVQEFKEGDYNFTGLKAFEIDEKFERLKELKNVKKDATAEEEKIHNEIISEAEDAVNIFIDGKKKAWFQPPKPKGAGTMSWAQWGASVKAAAKRHGFEDQLPPEEEYRGESKGFYTFKT